MSGGGFTLVKTSWAVFVARYTDEDVPVSVTRYPADYPIPSALATAEQINVTDDTWPAALADRECVHGWIDDCPECRVQATPTPKEAKMKVQERIEAALRAVLADGPVPASVLNEALVAAGINLTNTGAIAAARKAVGVVAFRKPGERGWFASVPAAIVTELPAAPELAARARALSEELLDQARTVRDAHEAAAEPLVDVGIATAAIAPDTGIVCAVCHVATDMRIAGVPLCDDHLDRWEEVWREGAPA